MDDIVESLFRAITTAQNDDRSEPGSDARDRHHQRVSAMLDAVDEIRRLRHREAA